jgi:hypothetical protein
MRIASICLIILLSTYLLSTHAATAQTRTAVPGKPLTLYRAYATNPDCTSSGDAVIRVTEASRYGRVLISRTGVFPRFSESNLRSVCNRRRVPGTVATYVAQRGYAGPNSVSLEAIFSPGELRQGSFTIMVR